MKRWFIILILLFSFNNLFASDYIESMDYLKVDSLMEINNLIKGQEEDYKAFYLLDEKIRDNSLHQDALVLKGWLAYRYNRYSEAIGAWQLALDLNDNSYHSWVNLWLSWLYLREGNILGSLDTFKKIKKSDLRDSQDENLYLTLKSRLTYFPLPIKENPKLYLDFISFMEPHKTGIFLGNVYGGVVYLDMLSSNISVIEKPIPSMKGNPVICFVYSEREDLPDGFFYSNNEGIFFVDYENNRKKEKLPNLPIKTGKANTVKNASLFGGDLAVHFSKEGLWLYRVLEGKWEFITKDIKDNSFLFSVTEALAPLFFLDKESKLRSINWSYDTMENSISIIDNIILKENYFKPILVNSNEFWLATIKGNLYKVTFSLEEEEVIFNLASVREAQEGDKWLSIWRGKKSGLFNIITQKGLWQRLDSQGNIVNSSKFLVPILSNLIHYYALGGDYIYLNMASEVYAVNEELFFNQ